MSKFNVQNFRSSIGKGLAFQSNFRVMFSGPLFRSRSIEGLTMMCNQATIPGRLVDASDVFTYGPRRRQAHRNVYDDLQLSFYCRDKDMFPRGLFEDWQNAIVDVYTNRVSYYDDYAVDMEIEQFDSTGKTIYSVRVVDAFPTNVNPLALDWSAAGVIQNLSVVFSLRTIYQQKIGFSPFSKWLTVNNLYPNVDIAGALDEFGMAIITQNGAQAIRKWKQGQTFAENLSDVLKT